MRYGDYRQPYYLTDATRNVRSIPTFRTPFPSLDLSQGHAAGSLANQLAVTYPFALAALNYDMHNNLTCGVTREG